MQMDEGYRSYLRQRYAFAEWEGRDDPGQGGRIDDTPFEGSELPGWRLRRVTRRETDDGIILLRGLWEPTAGTRDSVVDVELFFCATPARARAYLLELLGDMQGPDAMRDTARDVGDVMFSLQDDATIVFVRANVAARVRNAGRVVGSVLGIARALDNWLGSRIERR